MKKINILYVISLILGMTLSSCLKSDLEELPSYSEANITTVSSVEYRYLSGDISPVNNQKIVKYVKLNHTMTVDKERGQIGISVTVPASFPVVERSNLNENALVVALGLSTAARISPIENSASLGVPSDWSKINYYQVTAADGTAKKWEIVLKLNK